MKKTGQIKCMRNSPFPPPSGRGGGPVTDGGHVNGAVVEELPQPRHELGARAAGGGEDCGRETSDLVFHPPTARRREKNPREQAATGPRSVSPSALIRSTPEGGVSGRSAECGGSQPMSCVPSTGRPPWPSMNRRSCPTLLPASGHPPGGRSRRPRGAAIAHPPPSPPGPWRPLASPRSQTRGAERVQGGGRGGTCPGFTGRQGGR